MLPDTSVTFSLAELAKLEAERVREEDGRRARARDAEARAAREAEAQRRAAEAARVAAEVEATARRERAEAEEKVRGEARRRAEIEVARIAADAKARLDADNAARAHELAVLRARAEGGSRNRQRALVTALVVTLSGGAAAGYQMSRHVAALEQEASELRDARQALAREREHGKTTELAALDRRYAMLLARPCSGDATEARATAVSARRAVDPSALENDRLRTFADALDALDARLATLEKIAALDRRSDDLAAWAAASRRSEIIAPAHTAAVRAKATGNDEALRAYAGTLEEIRAALAERGTTADRHGGAAAAANTTRVRCDPHVGDPGCGLDGFRMF